LADIALYSSICIYTHCFLFYLGFEMKAWSQVDYESKADALQISNL